MSKECVKVTVRCRPMNQKEMDQSNTDNLECQSVVKMDASTGQVKLLKPNSNEIPKNFTFDAVYDEKSIQQTVYDESAFSLVESVLEGYNGKRIQSGTIFAYGQTGCGKTHTMVGYDASEINKGVIPRSFAHIFGCIDAAQSGKKFLVRCSFLEIYNENILDLLSHSKDDTKLDIKEDPQKGIYVKDLTQVITKTIPEIDKCMVAGKTGATEMNKDSSRSHSIFTIYIECSEEDETGEQRIRAGKMHLVDLAGSERQSKTHSEGDRLKEAQKINLSLSALGNVISALVDGKSKHIPYRDSKLTRMLQDSLGGNTKTVMIAAVSPANYNYDETLSTLRYAARAKQIKNKPIINEDPKDALLRQYEDEIKQLKIMLEQINSGEGAGELLRKMSSSYKEMNQNVHLEESIDQLVKKLEQKGKKVKIQESEGSEKDDTIQEVDGELEHSARKKKKPKKQNPHEMSFNERFKELEDIENVKDELFNQNVELEDKLKEESKRAELEKEEKQKLEDLLMDMQNRLVIGGQALEEKDKEKAQAYRQFQLKLKKQRKKENKVTNEKAQREEDLLLVEREYQNLQEQVDDNKKTIYTLREKWKSAQQEVHDIEIEHQTDKEGLLQSIRDQERDLMFFKRLCRMCLKDDEIKILTGKSKFDDDLNDWDIPAFQLRKHEIMLPKIKPNGINKAMDQEKENRVMELDNGSYHEDRSSSRLQSGNQVTRKPKTIVVKKKNVLMGSYNHSQPPNRRGSLEEDTYEGTSDYGMENSKSQKIIKPMKEKEEGLVRKFTLKKSVPRDVSESPEMRIPLHLRFAGGTDSTTSLMERNSKASAQLAPLTHDQSKLAPVSVDDLKRNMLGSGGGDRDVMNRIPSISELNTYQATNKLAPLEHPVKK